MSLISLLTAHCLVFYQLGESDVNGHALVKIKVLKGGFASLNGSLNCLLSF